MELDIEYRKLADESGVPSYVRVPALGVEAAFIAGLCEVVAALRARGDAPLCSHGGGRICPAGHAGCPATAAVAVA